jgi:hypothetical protein
MVKGDNGFLSTGPVFSNSPPPLICGLSRAKADKIVPKRGQSIKQVLVFGLYFDFTLYPATDF